MTLNTARNMIVVLSITAVIRVVFVHSAPHHGNPSSPALWPPGNHLETLPQHSSTSTPGIQHDSKPALDFYGMLSASIHHRSSLEQEILFRYVLQFHSTSTKALDCT